VDLLRGVVCTADFEAEGPHHVVVVVAVVSEGIGTIQLVDAGVPLHVVPDLDLVPARDPRLRAVVVEAVVVVD